MARRPAPPETESTSGCRIGLRLGGWQRVTSTSNGPTNRIAGQVFERGGRHELIFARLPSSVGRELPAGLLIGDRDGPGNLLAVRISNANHAFEQGMIERFRKPHDERISGSSFRGLDLPAFGVDRLCIGGQDVERFFEARRQRISVSRRATRDR